MQDHEVRYALNVKAGRKLRMSFRINLQHNSLSGHVRRGAGDFRGGGATRSAPFRPEVDEHGNRNVLNDLIEERIVDCERFTDWRQG
jgi:hypothetical protein